MSKKIKLKISNEFHLKLKKAKKLLKKAGKMNKKLDKLGIEILPNINFTDKFANNIFSDANGASKLGVCSLNVQLQNDGFVSYLSKKNLQGK
jgi:hypothetical protein